MLLMVPSVLRKDSLRLFKKNTTLYEHVILCRNETIGRREGHFVSGSEVSASNMHSKPRKSPCSCLLVEKSDNGSGPFQVDS